VLTEKEANVVKMNASIQANRGIGYLLSILQHETRPSNELRGQMKLEGARKVLTEALYTTQSIMDECVNKAND
jgi:hypothetical protein